MQQEIGLVETKSNEALEEKKSKAGEIEALNGQLEECKKQVIELEASI